MALWRVYGTVTRRFASKEIRLIDENELVRRAQAGDNESFCRLAQAYERRIYSLAFHYCRERQDAEDLSQEVWLRAYSALATFVILKVMSLVTALRAVPRSEGLGMDVTQHGEEAYSNGEGSILVIPDAAAVGAPAPAFTPQAVAR